MAKKASSDGVYRVTEVIGTSKVSWEDAAKNAVSGRSQDVARSAHRGSLEARHESGRRQGRRLSRARPALVQVRRLRTGRSCWRGASRGRDARRELGALAGVAACDAARGTAARFRPIAPSQYWSRARSLQTSPAMRFSRSQRDERGREQLPAIGSRGLGCLDRHGGRRQTVECAARARRRHPCLGYVAAASGLLAARLAATFVGARDAASGRSADRAASCWPSRAG